MNRRNKISVFLFYLLLLQITLAQSQQYMIWKGDTINRIDAEGKKQGKWIRMGMHKPGACYKEEQIVEEGMYLNNRKTGIWKEYYCNGYRKNMLTFVDGRPFGEAEMYNENGKISEKGYWKRNRWVGPYYRYDDAGEIEVIYEFDSLGKRIKKECYDYIIEQRESINRYFRGTPQVPIDGDWMLKKANQMQVQGYFSNGYLISGKIYTYNTANKIDRIMNYRSGKYTGDSELLFNEDPFDLYNESRDKLIIKKDSIYPDKTIFTPGLKLNGHHTLYNKNKQITKEGIFKDNQLMDGKAYIYDENGVLVRVAVYKNGIYVGDTTPEK